MNIGLFTDTYFPQINGVGTSTYTLAKQLRKQGHNVYIFTPSDPNDTESEYDEGVIRMPSMPFVFIHSFRVGLVYSPNELAKIAGLHLDIVHTQTEFSLGMFGKTFSKTFGIPMIHTYHTMYEDYVHYIVNGALVTTSMAHFLSRVFCNFALQVIAPTAKVKSSLLQYGVTKPINIVPTGINIDKFRKANYNPQETLALKYSLGLEKNNRVILFVGRVAKEKSIDVIINGLPEVFEKNENAVFLVVGDGPYRETLEKQAQALGIENRVIFAGAKPWAEIGKYYQLGDIFVSASVSETQGLTFVEAMAAGLPVIAKKDPCIDGVIEDEENGLVFENDNEVSKKILEILNDSEKYAKLSKKATLFSENLSEEAFVKSVEAVYERAIADYNCMPHMMRHTRKIVTDKERSLVHIRHTNSVRKIAEYELVKINRVRHKIHKMAISPAQAVKKYIDEKNENGGN